MQSNIVESPPNSLLPVKETATSIATRTADVHPSFNRIYNQILMAIDEYRKVLTLYNNAKKKYQIH